MITNNTIVLSSVDSTWIDTVAVGKSIYAILCCGTEQNSYKSSIQSTWMDIATDHIKYS